MKRNKFFRIILKTLISSIIPYKIFTKDKKDDLRLIASELLGCPTDKSITVNVNDDKPDFLIDMGDTFRTSKLREINFNTISYMFIDQRKYRENYYAWEWGDALFI